MTAASRATPSQSRDATGASTWVVILAGGVGSRFWPASIPRRPKQLLPLGRTGQPLVRETVQRALDLVPPERLRILTGRALRDPILQALPDLPESCVWTEPQARGTGPALLWAAHRIQAQDPGATMVSLHSDHVVEPAAGFTATLQTALRLARDTGLLFTVAAPPDRPETGYGYIRPGAPLASANGGGHEGPRAFRVEQFQEKPDRETAARYIEEGCLWNTGIFVWRTDGFLREARAAAPELGDSLDLLAGDGSSGGAEAFFDGVPSISVDHAVLERSREVGAVQAEFRWDDVGSWEALARMGDPDEADNFAVGQAHVADGTGNLVYSGDGRPIVLYGVDGLVVVRTPEATLVTTRERAAHLKGLVDDLPGPLKDPPAPPEERESAP